MALTFPDHLKRLADRDDLPVTTRYAAERLHELCAPGTHFAYSAAFLIDPITAVHELVVCSETFLRESEFRFPAMLSSLRNTKWLLTSDTNLKDWFTERREELLTAIDNADQVPRALEQKDARSWLEEKVRQDVLSAARDLGKELKAGRDGYRRRLLDQVCATMQGNEPATPGAWIKYDKSLGTLAAMLLTDGRVGAQTAERLGIAIGDAASAAEAADRLRAVVDSDKEEFEVAIVIHGASTLDGVDAFGFRCLVRPCCWADDPHRRSDGRLRSFMAPLTDGQRACGVVARVSAYDPAHARQRALKQATELRDSLHARYRTCRFTPDTTVLVRAADCTVSRQESTAGGVSVASPLTEEPVQVLRESLRYAGEARDRSMPVASVMSAWISMERMAKGARRRDRARTEGPAQSPGTFLPKRVGSLMGLVAMRSVWTVSWHLAQMAGREGDRADDWTTIEQHLGVRGSFVNLRAWAKLLTNDSTSPRDRRHAELLAELIEGFPPLVRVRLLVARDMLLRGQAFVDWVNPLIAVAHAQIDRLVLLRHRAVHEALADAAGARELELVGLFTLDAIFQVVPRWLEGADVAGQPWKALDEIYGWRRRVVADWKRNQRPVDSDPERILTRYAERAPRTALLDPSRNPRPLVDAHRTTRPDRMSSVIIDA